jgi:hypothetical protein
MSRPVRMIEAMDAAYRKLVAGDARGAAALLEQAEGKYPESLIRLIDAAARLRMAERLERGGDRAGCLRESRRAYQLAEEAAKAPTLLPFGPYRHNADWLCVFIEVAWGVQVRYDTASLAGAVIPGGGNPLGMAMMLAAGQDDLGRYPPRSDRRHLLRVAADSGAYDEARSEVVPQLLDAFEVDDARLLLTDWANDAPKDPAPCRLGVRLELEHQNYAEALRWAERGLAVAPNDGELRRARDRAGEALKAVAPAGKAAGKP